MAYSETNWNVQQWDMSHLHVFFYVGRVVMEVNGQNEIEVSFLRRSLKFEGNFVNPNVADISLVPTSGRCQNDITKTRKLRTDKRAKLVFIIWNRFWTFECALIIPNVLIMYYLRSLAVVSVLDQAFQQWDIFFCLKMHNFLVLY